jgi:hypothetical protein
MLVSAEHCSHEQRRSERRQAMLRKPAAAFAKAGGANAHLSLGTNRKKLGLGKVCARLLDLFRDPCD